MGSINDKLQAFGEAPDSKRLGWYAAPASLLFWYVWAWRIPTGALSGYGEPVDGALIAIAFAVPVVCFLVVGVLAFRFDRMSVPRRRRVILIFAIVVNAVAIAMAVHPAFSGPCSQGRGPWCSSAPITHSFFFAGVVVMALGAIGALLTRWRLFQHQVEFSPKQKVTVIRLGSVAIPPAFVLGGLGFIAFGQVISDTSDLEPLQTRGQETTATIVRLHGDHDATTYKFKVRGRWYRGQDVTSSAVDTADLEIGDPIETVYDPEDPDRSTLRDPAEVIEDTKGSAAIPTIMGVFLIIATTIKASTSPRVSKSDAPSQPE